MKRLTLSRVAATALLIGIAIGSLVAQQPAAPAGPQPYFVGNRLGMPINPAATGIQPDVQQRQGVRLGVLGRELLLRSGP